MRNWIAGILATVISGVAVWYFTQPKPTPPPPPPCHISGTVYNNDTKQPLANIQVKYTPHNQTQAVYLVTNGADGKFDVDCQKIDQSSYPLKLELTSSDWSGYVTRPDEVIEAGGKENINIYVSVTQVRQGIIRSSVIRSVASR